jgi:hypothetical protein
MDYTSTLNAHESQQVREFVRKTNTEPINAAQLPPRSIVVYEN